MSWSSFGALLETARAQLSTAPHEGNLLDDVVALLRRRGLMRPTFHGFEIASTPPLGWGAGVLWRRGQRSLWNIHAKVSPWSAPHWLSGEIGARSGFQGFGALSVGAPTPWPTLRWFSADARKKR